MRCYYREKQYVCGDYIDVQVYPVYAKPGQRRSKAKPSSEVQEKLNAENSKKHFIRTVHTNFTNRDYAVHLTYADAFMPQDAERAKKDIQNFLKKLKRRYKALEKELKYVWVAEIGVRSRRMHFHVIVSGGLSRDEIEELWGFGYANAKRLRFNEHGIAGLASYMTKQKLLFKSWSGSRNLKKPIVKTNDYKYSQKTVKDIVEHEQVLLFCSFYPGLSVSSFNATENYNNGGFYISARMFNSRLLI